MYYLVLGMLGVICLFNIFTIIGARSSSIASWIAPLLFIFILTVHVIVPAVKYDHTYYRWLHGYPDEVAIPQVLLLIVATTFLTIILHLRLSKLKRSVLPALPVSPNWNIFVFITYLAGAAFALRDLQLISQIGGIDAYLTDRIGAADERGMARLFGFFMVTAIACYAYVNCRVFTLGRMLTLAAMCALPLYYYTVLTSRNSLLFLFMLVVFALLLSRDIKLTFNRRLVTAALSIALLAYGGSLLVSESIDSRMAGRQLHVPEWLHSADGAFGNDEALLFYAMRSNRDAALGATYAAAAVAWVPRALWEGKPTGGGPFLVNMIYPGKYVVGAEGNSSYTTGMYVEAVLNFGIVGYFLVPIIWVFAVAACCRKALTSASVEAQLIWAIIAFTLCTGFVYMEFLGFVARVGTLLFPIFVWQLAGMFNREQKRKLYLG